MEKSNSIFVVEEHGSLFESLKAMDSAFETKKAGYPELLDALRKLSPQAVIFNLDHQAGMVKEILKKFHDQHPQTYWVLSGEAVSHQELVDFMRLGVRDFLKQPLSEREFKDLMTRIEQWHNQKKEVSCEIRQTVSFFSCKGGVGLSMAAVNTAVALAKQAGKVLVADFVLQHGNIAELLDVSPQYTLLDVLQNLERLDAKLLENSLPKHRSGAFVLPCPKQPEESEFFSGKDMAQMFKTLKETFNVLVLDVGHEMNNVTLACLDASDTVFLVTTPDVPSLSNARIALETFRKMGYKDGKVKLVLNRWHMKGEVELSLIEKNLKFQVVQKISEDPLFVLKAVNQGVPLVELSKNAEIVKCFEKLAEQIQTAGAVKEV